MTAAFDQIVTTIARCSEVREDLVRKVLELCLPEYKMQVPAEIPTAALHHRSSYLDVAQEIGNVADQLAADGDEHGVAPRLRGASTILRFMAPGRDALAIRMLVSAGYVPDAVAVEALRITHDWSAGPLERAPSPTAAANVPQTLMAHQGDAEALECIKSLEAYEPALRRWQSNGQTLNAHNTPDAWQVESAADAMRASSRTLRRLAGLTEVSELCSESIGQADPDRGGRVVREAWVRWAQLQPDAKPSWLLPYDELSAAEKGVDRQIFEACAAEVRRRFEQNQPAANVGQSQSPSAIAPTERV